MFKQEVTYTDLRQCVTATLDDAVVQVLTVQVHAVVCSVNI